MNDATGLARRYHWHSPSVRDFTAAPHTGIAGEHQGTIMNLVDAGARPVQQALLTMAREPDAHAAGGSALLAPPVTAMPTGQLSMPFHHDVRGETMSI